MNMINTSRELIKDSIKNLRGYDANNIACTIKLDANEGKCKVIKSLNNIIEGNVNVNLYPDDSAKELKNKIKEYINMDASNLVVGSGSSELVELIIKTFVDKDESILTFVPTFSMYEVYAKVNSTKFIGVECDEDFVVNIDKLIKKAKEVNPKLIFLCNPNNPTGYLLKKEDIKKVLDKIDCIVVVDEAYIEFATTNESMVDEINNYDKLIVLRTFSKAFSLASIRVGYMVSNKELASIIETVRPPYNVNSISQLIAIKSLYNVDKVLEYSKEVKKQREYLLKELKYLNMKVYDSEANFIFFSCNIKELYKKLIEKDILIRDFGKYFRVTVGEEMENTSFIDAIKEIIKKEEFKYEKCNG